MEKLRSELEVLKEKYESNEQALRDRDETIKNNNMGGYLLVTSIFCQTAKVEQENDKPYIITFRSRYIQKKKKRRLNRHLLGRLYHFPRLSLNKISVLWLHFVSRTFN